jgi:hypothetical protein
MLAQVWGPLVWRVLEGVANHGDGLHTRPPSTKHAFAQTVQLLPLVMPCSVCRAEFASLLKDGGDAVPSPPPGDPTSTDGAVRAAWAAWDPARWLFVLHANVQRSITQRRVRTYLKDHPGAAAKVLKSGVPTPTAVDFVTAVSIPALTFDTVKLRVQLAHGHYFSTHDLWVMLALFCGACAVLGERDADADADADVQARAAHVCAFAQHLAQVLVDIDLHRAVAKPLASKMCGVAADAHGKLHGKLPAHRLVVTKLCAAFGKPEREALAMARAALVVAH